jgi:hypothetical protein
MILKKKQNEEKHKILPLEGDLILEFLYFFFVDFFLSFHRTKEDEQEEIKIREELKTIDAVLKKNKKAVIFTNLFIFSLFCVNE